MSSDPAEQETAVGRPSTGDTVCVVTGATRGIGRAVAVAAATAGMQLVICGRSTRDAPNGLLPGGLEEVSEQIEALGTAVHGVRADLAQEADRDRVIRETLDRFGRCDILINNAAYIPSAPGLTMPLRRWQRTIEVNYLAAAHLILGFGTGMADRGFGHVVNVGSQAAVREVRGQVAYGASKAALERLTIGLASELGQYGVRMTCLRVDEPVTTELWHWTRQSGLLDALGSEVDTGATADESSLYTPAEVAAAVVALVSRPMQAGPVVGFADLRRLGMLPAKPRVHAAAADA